MISGPFSLSSLRILVDDDGEVFMTFSFEATCPGLRGRGFDECSFFGCKGRQKGGQGFLLVFAGCVIWCVRSRESKVNLANESQESGEARLKFSQSHE